MGQRFSSLAMVAYISGLVIFWTPPATALASFIDAKMLSDACEDEASKSLCLGFVAGVADSFDCADTNFGYTWDRDQYNVTVGQLKKVSEKYLRDHPESLHLAAASLVARALSEAFPCP